MAAYELKTFFDDIYRATGVTNKHDSDVTLILDFLHGQIF
jgi:hypothetical protein